MSRALRELVATGCRVLDLMGQGDLNLGHLSARDEAGRGVWMKGAGLGFEEVDPDDVILVSWDGEVLEGDRPRHVEYPIHTEVMRARPGAGAVVHTHPRAAVAFAALGVPLRPICNETTLFVPPDLPRFSETTDLIVTPELGGRVAAALGGSSACLLVNHGIVAAGGDVPSAVVTACLLDRACAVQLAAMSAGTLASWSSPEESLAKRAHCHGEAQLRSAWDYLVRRLAR